MTLHIDDEKLHQQLARLAEFRDPSQPGWTRRSFSPEYQEARRWLYQQMESVGLTPRIDAGGNLVGQHEGPKKSLLITGSHTDTVIGGGRFDGMFGVLAGIECARALNQADWPLKHTFQVYDFLAEEPSPYKVSTVGSRAVSGHLSKDLLALTNAQGEALADGLIRVGGQPEKLDRPLLTATQVAAYLELHVEQGPYLETHNLSMGIVTGIVGIRRYHLAIRGTPGHAGTTPMVARHDALVAASRIIDSTYSWALERSGQVVATVGQVDVHPNALNVIPGSAHLGIEVRSLDTSQFDAFESFLRMIMHDVLGSTGCHVDMHATTREDPALMHPRLQKLLAQVLQENQWSFESIPSWAGHDAVQMTHVTPQCAMLFVPSHLGLSHCPEEWTQPSDLVRGANALLQSILKFDDILD